MRIQGYYGKLSFVVATLTCMLLGCSHNSPAPVYDLYSNSQPKKSSYQRSSYQRSDYQRHNRRQSTSVKSTDAYVVQAGDTLFSIAWYHAVDHRELARINHLKNNLIYPGQKLMLSAPESLNVFNAESLLMALNREVLNKPISLPEKKVANNTQYRLAKARNKTKHSTSTRRSLAKENTSKAKSKNSSKVSKVASVSRFNKTNKRSRNSRSIKKSSLNWIWPANGKIIERFSTKFNNNRGLDIAGERGQPVRASAPGRVVYEGSGLRGYGNLVIIKHDSNYLSAYAHNEKIYVSENEVVKAGQRIADIGSSGAKRDKLHFEIRYKGKPVDPLNYLPEKSSKKF